MMLKGTLSEIVKSQRNEINTKDYGVERNKLKDIDLELPHALIIAGVRRCGKSTLLHQILKQMRGFYYLNFEDPRLAGFEVADFEKLDEIFAEEYGKAEFYLFDEIQNINGWELFVRSGLDKKKKFIITGSNASLLSKELGTRLTGRHMNLELFPFAFNETLIFKKEEANTKSFERYMSNGGFPEYLKYKKEEILRELFTDIIQRDIVARYGIRDSKTLKEMALFLLTNVGKEFSYNNLKKTFALGSINTAISFVSYFEDSYLIFTIPKFDYSLKKRLISRKKVYSIDNGLSGVNSVSFSSDRGRKLENAVFLNLRRKYREVFYFKEKYECDFLVSEGNKIKIAVQVSYEINEDNKIRELGGLIEAMEKFELKEGLILTNNQSDEFKTKGMKIIMKPAWKWMMTEVY